VKDVLFDKAYYEKFYLDAKTQAVSTQEQERQVNLIHAHVNYLQVEIRSVLDLGCGLGVFLQCLKAAMPNVDTTGVEISDFLCHQHGWSKGSVVDFGIDSEQQYDLVICNDVLAYLSNAQCAKAIKNIAKLTRQCLYLSVLTEEDLPICDQQSTDMRQQIRSSQWYKKQLAKDFCNVGGGLFIRKPLSVPVWQLEQI
jgi:2-polyprenyl-3-methyl-5-hydroxy-6-metoxy-1,4-benzoquinol methylase